jgi:IS5 family transposase
MIANIKTNNKGEERSLSEMREKQQDQLPLTVTSVDHPRAEELKRISDILDKYPIISEMVWQDLTKGVKKHQCGAKGMSAEQVLRAAIIKQTEGFSYDDLAFHLLDSRCYRSFCRIGVTHKGFRKSALCGAIKFISSQSWEAINRIIVAHAQDKKIEKGRQVRMDCTVVSSNIHEPTDSSLLWDAVRVITRMLGQAKDQSEDIPICFSDHTKRAKRRMLAIQHGKTQKARVKNYRDLLDITEKVLRYASAAINHIEKAGCLSLLPLVEDLKRVMALTEGVINQTVRRVFNAETVPAEEKIVSLFEPHSDIIKKDRRETFYGHKICLSVGGSKLVTDCMILKGNPADTTLVEQMLNRHDQIYGRHPLKVAMDGGFASKENLRIAKSMHIKDVCFSKKRGIKLEQMCRSDYVYKRLRRFRAGIESAISWLKRSLGLDRCTWKSLESFHSYVWASIVSANLLTLAKGNGPS